MAVMLNGPGEKNARTLIQAGKVDRDSAWAFSSADSDILLGTKGDDWTEYEQWFLGADAEVAHHTKEHFKYPIGKDGKVFRAALISIRQRASQQDATGVYEAAGKLLEAIDAAKSSALTLTRRATFDCGFQVKAVDAGGVFSGYGSVYGSIDDGDDIVMPGCFTDSLKAWGAKGRMPAMLWQHDQRQPIGAYTLMREDDSGLFVEGQLAMKTQKGAECYELLKMGALSGLSIGYLPTDFDCDMKSGVRTIKTADLFEISLVTFPMNDQARVDNVKGIESIEDLNGMERFLREVGVSRSEAKAIVSRMLSIARREVAQPDESDELQAITALLKQRTQVLRA